MRGRWVRDQEMKDWKVEGTGELMYFLSVNELFEAGPCSLNLVTSYLVNVMICKSH